MALKAFSSSTFQPKATEGNKPHRLSGENRLEPSERSEAVIKYLPKILMLLRPKNDISALSTS
jgi:hypothetical protein